MEWINFRHLYAFWAVCKYGGFSKAADRLFVSQSTVSEQVAQLEDYLGEELLERSTRSVRVTSTGAALRAYADEIFERSTEINRIFRDKDATLRSASMRVGMVGGISRNFVFNQIQEVLKVHEGARIELINGSVDELAGMLRAFELDLILTIDRPRPQDMATMQLVRAQSSPLRLVGTPDLVTRLRSSKTPEAVDLYTFQYPFEGPPLSEVCAERYGFIPRLPISTDDISLLRFFANSGRGLALVPEIGVFEDMKAGRVVCLEVPGDPRVDIYAITLIRRWGKELVDHFLEQLK